MLTFSRLLGGQFHFEEAIAKDCTPSVTAANEIPYKTGTGHLIITEPLACSRVLEFTAVVFLRRGPSWAACKFNCCICMCEWIEGGLQRRRMNM